MASRQKAKPSPKRPRRKVKPKPEKPRGIGRLDTVCMAIVDLTLAGYNPRKIDKASIVALQASVKKFALVEPVVWNKRSGTVVGGHQRLKVLVELGAIETDVVVVDLNKADERALNLALNSPHLQGDFDKDKLEAMMEDLVRDLPELDFKALRLDELFTPPTAVDLNGDPPPKDDAGQEYHCPKCGFQWGASDEEG